jgi:competence protein ComEA
VMIATLGVQTDGSVGFGTASKLVNLNLADAATLDTLPGIGPTLAQRIIDYRTANGGFRSISDLGKVAGIGASLMEKLKTLVSL